MSRKIEREIEFTDWWFKEHHKAPTYADAIEWAERTMIDKACEWIDSNARHYLQPFVMETIDTHAIGVNVINCSI